MLYQCNNCGWETDERSDVADQIVDFYQRVESGDRVPEGECPECGCFVHKVDADYVREAMSETLLADLSYLVEYLRFHTAESADWDALLPEHKSILERCEATILKATTGLPE